MERRRIGIGMVLAVFYGVDPLHVGSQTGEFGEAFDKLLNRISPEEDQVQRWRMALRDASGIPGFNGSKSEDIGNLVGVVTRLRDKISLFGFAEQSVGVESRVQEVIQLLNSKKSEHPLVLGIWGIGGIGKTTVAKAIYKQIGLNFDDSRFILNVRSGWEQNNGQAPLQEWPLSGIYKKTKIKMGTIEAEIVILKENIRPKKLLLVLDDVNKFDQLKALCGSREWFGPGSVIIITTRYEHLLLQLGVDHAHRMKEMDKNESLELFSWHAFKQASPTKRFEGLSNVIVEYSGGFMLVLQVLGSFLFSKGKKEWNSALEKLKMIPHDDVLSKLKISFDDLRDEVKKIFLDIALFFIGMVQGDVVKILNDSGLSAKFGISVLVQKVLVTVDQEYRLGMHDMLRDMAREIIKKESRIQPEPRIFEYDVFLSFRGKDTRASFTSHLCTSLQNAAIRTFRDDDEIRRGDQIKISLWQAIRMSKIIVIVLSRNYANSRWCMEELEFIMENCRTKGQVVVPVFYGVDPSEVRNLTGEFGEAFKDLKSRISMDANREKNWRKVLLEVGGIAGFVVIDSRDETEDIRNIVESVTGLLDNTDLFVAEHPVGIESRVQDVIQLLNNQQTKHPLLLGILGMGGVGKTTVAKAIYNEVGRNFRAKSFLLNVREDWEKSNGQISLQQRLLSDIYKTTKVKIDTTELGKVELQKRLSQKRIFLVLDDVDKLDQLNALCGSRKWFGRGSRIIITTRDKHLLSVLRVDRLYRMKEMDKNESLELFSWHAFKQASPNEGFANISRDVVKYSGGLPLALQVLGSFLNSRGVRDWESALEKLKIIPNHEILRKLKISFDGLNDDKVKEIFLDIAFFFIGKDRDDVIEILNDCGLFAEIGISELVEKSLVTVNNKNRLGMHDLLRDMGREIVREKSPELAEERSRVWLQEDVLDVLSKDTGTIAVKGLTLKLPRMETTTGLKTKAFEKMKRLRLLQLAGIQLDGDYKYLSQDLRWLCWDGFPSIYTPEDFHQGSLVAIELKYSNMQQVWMKSKMLTKLKILNLSHSPNLRETPDFSKIPNLKKLILGLILKDCPRLSSVSDTIEHLKEILLINLKDCTGLSTLPRSIYKLKTLKILILSGCSKIDMLEEDLEQMESLTTLIADKTAIKRVPFSIVRSKSIAYISLCGYKGSSRDVFPSLIWSWMSPTNIVLSQVQTSAGMSSLAFLDEQNSSFHVQSSTLKDLQKLQRLWVECDSEVQLNETVERILDTLKTTNYEELEAMPSTSHVSNMKTSALIVCHSQARISGSKNSLTSLLIQMGMNCNVTNILRESILQKMSPIGPVFLPSDNYPDWLAFSGEGSSVVFDVPQVKERNLKTIMCLVYISSPDSMTPEVLKNMLVINYTKNTIQLYKRDALTPFEDEEWLRVVSNIEPGNKVKVVLVFENRYIVNYTTVFLIYGEPINEKLEHCHTPDKNAVVSGGDENSISKENSDPPAQAEMFFGNRQRKKGKQINQETNNAIVSLSL
ncbi:TMV resistance protein N-like [Gastrolobium bilobum]|uniref:TMV resistance protein N-like n=1 Tax=Gastrolobium bilobum TaxID=150636 RepID=UPI002AB1E063|nr:TMV resistance protein N-like [Gastrolobium bilobum]